MPLTSPAASQTYLAFHTIVKRTLTTLPLNRHHPQTLPRLTTLRPPHQTLVSTAIAQKGRHLPKNHFTSHTPRPQQNESSHSHPQSQPQQQSQNPSQLQHQPKNRQAKRKPSLRNPAPASLRRVAVEAQCSRGTPIKGRGKTRHVDPEVETREVTAYCAAERYDVGFARELFERDTVAMGGKGGQGARWVVDPAGTGMFPQVLHVRMLGPPSSTDSTVDLADTGTDTEADKGDVFVFPSGTVVTWNVPEATGKRLVESLLLPAAENPHLSTLEAEDLEYLPDPTRSSSEILGDTIILGTKPLSSSDGSHDHTEHVLSPGAQSAASEGDTLLTQIAFSSALARSTKLAVLETRLATYFHTTHDIPLLLSQGKKPRFTRAFILRKTGELLSIRAQLNLYSELTDSLPDIFWDSPHELGLESYYDAVGRALDVGVRIRVLNEKMDYASEIASVLRERLSERHGHLLEWIIILLILVEVGYGSLHLWREWREERDEGSERRLLRRWLLRELGEEER